MTRFHYISPSTVPSRSANAVHVAMQCDALAKAGAAVTLYAQRSVRSPAALPAALASAYGIDASRLEIVSYFSRAGRLANVRIAAMALRHVGGRTSGAVLSRNLYAAFALAVVRNRPLIFETHQLEVGTRGLMQRLAMTRPWVITVTVSKSLLDVLKNHHAAQPTRPLVLPDAAPDGMEPIPRERRRSELAELAPDTAGRWQAVCGYFGHLYHGRGLEIIDAMATNRPSSLFLVYGGNENEINRHRARTRRPNLRFMGHVPHVTARRLMCAVDILLMPYQHQVSIGVAGQDTARWMSPMKMFEYMGSGVPFIASDLPALREVLDDGRNCLLAAAESVDAWLAAHDRLVANTDLAELLGATAHRQYQTSHTWSRRATRLLETARSL